MNKLERRKSKWGYLFILPNFLGLLCFTLVPIFMSLFFSFTNYDVISQMSFVGVENYVGLFSDRRFISALVNTLYFCVLTVPTGVVLSLLLAVLLNRRIRGISIFRTMVFIPVITSMVAVSLVWSMLYEDNAGLLNTLLQGIGLPRVHWLTDTSTAMISIAIMSVWKGLGYNMTIFLAGLQGVPPELYEAARIDGAGGVRCFFKITLPSISPTIYFVTLMSLISGLQTFDQISIMTNGGPIDSTRTVAMYLYDYGFKFYKMGYACAAAYVLFLLVFVVSLIQNRASSRFMDN